MNDAVRQRQSFPHSFVRGEGTIQGFHDFSRFFRRQKNRSALFDHLAGLSDRGPTDKITNRNAAQTGGMPHKIQVVRIQSKLIFFQRVQKISPFFRSEDFYRTP